MTRTDTTDRFAPPRLSRRGLLLLGTLTAAAARAGLLAPAAAPPAEGEEGGMSRINLRMPDHLKSRIEQAATRLIVTGPAGTGR